MENSLNLFKGELMEEKLRLYFLNNGYYVVRGIKYSFEGNEITDIDLFLYGRVSILSRERTNVDIKNKKSPKAFERILWAKGVQELLGFDSCVVATMERKDSAKKYATQHMITLLDGTFLQKLSYELIDRLSEEELLNQLGSITSYKEFNNQNWKYLYEKSKSRLLNELDFSGYNTNLLYIKYFLKSYTDPQKKTIALRAIFLFMSHGLLTIDYLLKDIAFLEQDIRIEVLGNGFKYGNLGKEGVERTIDMAIKIANSKLTSNEIRKSIESLDVNMLQEYFAKTDTIKNIFKWAISFERLAYSKSLILPKDLDPDLKGCLAILLDYFKISRKSFFEG